MQTRWIRISLLLLLLVVMVLAAGVGAMKIPVPEVLRILAYKAGIPVHPLPDVAMMNVFWELRLPRVLMAVMIGGGLAIAGASLQGLFRNPLADPMLIGISSGASLAAVLVIVLYSFLPSFLLNWLPRYYLLNVVTFAGACACSLLVFRLSTTGNRTAVASLLLAGLAITALCNAFIGLITYTANDEELRNITFWSLGSLGGASWRITGALAPFIILPVIVLPVLSKSLNAYSLGETEAHYLGVNVRRLKIGILGLSTLAVGAAVASAGMIGFVGLVVPHILRSVTGTDHRQLLFNSAVLGAVLLTLADTVGRTIIAPAELPIGIVTALIGTPVFITLLLKQRKKLGGLETA